jgi:hypothetical protein
MSDSRPVDLPEVGTATGGRAAGTAARPSMAPPPGAAAARAAAAGGGATVWNNGQTVNALWSINQDRNAWMSVAGVGWAKLSNASETGIMSLNVLASHAKQLQTQINYRQESDNMVHEIYAW